MNHHEIPTLSPRLNSKVRDAGELVLQRVENNRFTPLKNLLLPLLIQSVYSETITSHTLGTWEVNGEKVWIPRFHFRRTNVIKQRIQVGIFAGIHGNEPGGILGLMNFIRTLDETPEIGRSFELWIYPVCNPSGYLAQTRESASGKDLNREFWKGSTEKEIQLLEQEIQTRQFDGIISLHSDDTCSGFYGFARGDVMARQLLAPALEAAEAALPRDSRSVIDGFSAINGIIEDCYDGVLSAPAHQSPQPFELILESPALAPLEAQREAFTLALQSILTEYRKFIAYGADL